MVISNWDLICILQTSNDVEHILYLPTIYISTLWTSNLFHILLLVIFLLSFKSSLYILDRHLSSTRFCKYFTPVFPLFSNILNDIFQRAQIFTFEKVLFGFFPFMVNVFYLILEIFAFSKVARYSSLFSFRSYTSLVFIFRSLVHFDVILLYGSR